MAEVVLFHHAQGLTPGVAAFAEDLRAAGHTVHTPDLFEGRTFATLEEGLGHAQSIGFSGGAETGAVTSLPSDGPAARGVVRLLNTAGGRVLCLAGDVDGRVVDYFLRRYGREPMRIDGIDTGSVTWLSPPAVDLVRDHLDAARRAGHPVAVRSSPQVASLIPRMDEP
jgi:hypothetical protein